MEEAQEIENNNNIKINLVKKFSEEDKELNKKKHKYIFGTFNQF